MALDDPDATVTSLRELARSQQGAGQQVDADIATIAQEAVRAVAHEARAQGVRVESDLRSAAVRGDPVLLERLVGNLLENAGRYNRPAVWGQVRTAAEGGMASLVVRNSGPTIAPGEASRLFEPFRRGLRERTGDDRGSGLGLSIVAVIAAAHGGSVNAVALPEGGMEVTVLLPVGRQE